MVHRNNILEQPSLMADFERDIEDAIVETIVPATKGINDPDQLSESHAAPGRSFKDLFGKPDIDNDNLAGQGFDPLGERAGDPIKGRYIFSKQDLPFQSHAFGSQVLLSISVCAFTMALVLPVVWWVSENVAQPNQAHESAVQNISVPDGSINTGSIPGSFDIDGLNFSTSSYDRVITGADGKSASGNAKRSSFVKIDADGQDNSVVYIDIK